MRQLILKDRVIGRFAFLVILGLLMLVVVSPTQADDDDDMLEAVPYQIVVKLMPKVDLARFNRDYQTTTLATLVSGSSIYLLATQNGADIERLAERMEKDRRVKYAEPNYYLEQPEIDRRSAWGWGGLESKPYSDHYARDLIRIAGAHALSLGAGVTVAVIDTGIQLDHPALAGSLVSTGLDLIDGDTLPGDDANGIDDDGDGEIDEGVGHGTHVAGIVHLIAPGAHLLPIRALDSDGRGNIFAIAEAVLFAVDQGAAIVNMSLGTPAESEILQEAIRSAAARDVLVVAAAGNLNSDVPQYPAADECALAVSAIGPAAIRSPFSNFGSWIDLVAPGESIYSPFPIDGYAWWSGTSMAAPFVSGTAALLRSADPALTAYTTAEYLGATARVIDIENPDFQGKLGYGLLDAEAALQASAQRQPPFQAELIKNDCGSVAPDDDDEDD
jgi:subtilisin family serine protease